MVIVIIILNCVAVIAGMFIRVWDFLIRSGSHIWANTKLAAVKSVGVYEF